MAQFYIKDVIKSMMNMNNDEGKQNINLQSAEDTEETSVEGLIIKLIFLTFYFFKY